MSKVTKHLSGLALLLMVTIGTSLSAFAAAGNCCPGDCCDRSCCHMAHK